METFTFINPGAIKTSPRLPVPPAQPKKKAKPGSGGASKPIRPKGPGSAPTVGKAFNKKDADLSYGNYIASHPQLLDDINGIIDRGLARISKKGFPKSQMRGPETVGFEQTMAAAEDSVESQRERLDVYRNAMRAYIEGSNIYKPFLNRVVGEYETSLRTLQEKVSEMGGFRAELAAIQDDNDNNILDLEKKHNAQIDKYAEKIVELERRVIDAEKKLAEREEETARAVAKRDKMEKEWEEMRVSCSTITNSLVRYEDANKHLRSQEAHQQAALLKLKVSEEKGNAEATNLRARVQELEQLQGMLASHEEIEEKTEEIEHLRLELKRSERENNLLVQRYAVLKSAIEVAFKKQLTRTATTLSDIVLISGHKPTMSRANNVEQPPAPSRVGTVPEHDNTSSSTGGGGLPGNELGLAQTDRDLQGLLEDPATTVAFMHYMSADFRSLIEALLDYIFELKSMGGIKVGSFHTIADGESKKSVGAVLEMLDKKKKKTSMLDDGDTFAVQDRVDVAWAHFEGLGDSPIVPPFLRIAGKVQNLFFSRKDVGTFIHTVMDKAKARIQEDTGEAWSAERDVKKSQSFPTYFYHYMLGRFRTQMKLVEISYNVIEGSRKYRHESDCRLFLAMLDGVLPEDAWYDMHATINDLLSTMLFRESKSISIVDGVRRLTVEEFIRTVRLLFPQKNNNALSRIVRALQLENKSHRYVMNLKALLTDNDDGARGMLCELLRSQYIAEMVEFLEYLTECINNLRGKEKNRDDEDTTVIGSLRVVLEMADPERSRRDVNVLLARGVGKTLEDMLMMEVKRVPVVISEFITNMKSGLVKKTAKEGAAK